jgi:hypothetical protein
VSYYFARLEDRCMPSRLQLTLATESGQNPSLTRFYPIRGLRARQSVAVPEFFVGAPDVVRANTVTRDGRRSQVVSVLVR